MNFRKRVNLLTIRDVRDTNLLLYSVNSADSRLNCLNFDTKFHYSVKWSKYCARA